MTYDVVGNFFACINEPMKVKIPELTRIIEESTHNKEFNAIFPQLIVNIFGWPSFSEGWGLRAISSHVNRNEYDAIYKFLHPQGPMFMLCYKMLGETQLTYNVSLDLLPVELRHSFETGRYAQFYADLLKFDPHVMNTPTLELNAFDYYIFCFALSLIHGSPPSGKLSTDTLYFNLFIEYALHFLPTDPSVVVLPILSNFCGKMPIVTPLQSANRSLTPSLLLKPNLSDLNNQHAQSENRNEVWRSETVLQVFTDVWMSVHNLKNNNVNMYRSYPDASTCAERVRLCRVLVKQVHKYASVSVAEPGVRAAALRRYSRQLICTRGYRCVKYFVEVWPLDASFKVVLELWLSLIQPWRYESVSDTGNWQRFNEIHEDRALSDSAANHVQFIAENFPTYTYILQMMLSRFLRLDLTVLKNTIMLFRLGKVFSQPHLLNVVRDLEKAVMANNDIYINGSNNPYDNNYSMLSRWGVVAKQSIAELNMNPNFLYEPLWTEQNKPMMLEFFKRIVTAQQNAQMNYEQFARAFEQENRGFWSFLMGPNTEDLKVLEEMKEVPKYLNNSIQYFSIIFGINDNTIAQDISVEDNSMERSFNTSDIQNSITQKLRNKSIRVSYMGDPDIMPITSYENTILVRMFYQISSKINDMYQDEFSRLWFGNSFWSLVAREILQEPCTIQTYANNVSNYNTLVSQNLPARLSLRKLGSHSFLIWLFIGFLFSKLFSFTIVSYLFTVFMLWASVIMLKVIAKITGFSKQTD